ncbi:hypothetical protein [Kamptonema formosum]|uniref:hypothetical protein n=1 Tax=Kamptonema formosum TaxID=331992 RepID=UPI0003751950|nr:hypothetical protein [Oscillatoria sp. PCC 10802]
MAAASGRQLIISDVTDGRRGKDGVEPAAEDAVRTALTPQATQPSHLSRPPKAIAGKKSISSPEDLEAHLKPAALRLG